MEAVIASLGKSIYSHGNNTHKGYLLSWNLIAPLCSKWSRNRDPDMQRVAEMHDFYMKGGYIPKVIHLAEIIGEGLVCYDGNHRRELFNQCKGDDIACIIDVMFNASQNDVYKAFNNINKSVQVPAVYLEEDTNETYTVKHDIIELVKSFESKYMPLRSTSVRCHAPHSIVMSLLIMSMLFTNLSIVH